MSICTCGYIGSWENFFYVWLQANFDTTIVIELYSCTVSNYCDVCHSFGMTYLCGAGVVYL